MIYIILFLLSIFVFPLFFPNISYSQLNEMESYRWLISSDTRHFIQLGGTWETIVNGKNETHRLPKIFYNCEKVEFRKILRLDKQLLESSTWHLYFLGITDEIEVFWNGQYLGKYSSDASPIWITVPEKVKVQETNEIRLIVRHSSYLPYITKKNYRYFRKIVTGIPREIFLVRTAPVWLSTITYSYDFDSFAKINLKIKGTINSSNIEAFQRKVNLQNLSPRLPIVVEYTLRQKETKQLIAQNSISSEIASLRSVQFEGFLAIHNPKLWEPDSPSLYELEVKLSSMGSLIDNYFCEVGFYKFDFLTHKGIESWQLNGKQFHFKGLEIIENYEYYYSGNLLNKIEEEIKNIKSLGANAIRFLFSAPHPYFLHLCNSYGLFVLVDLPNFYIPNSLLSKNDLFVNLQTISDNFLKYCNIYPSFLGLGIGNGLEYGTDKVEEFARKITQRIKSFERIQTYCSLPLGSKVVDFPFVDFFIVKDDWKIKNSEKVSKSLIEIANQLTKPLIFSFGVSIDPENRSGYNDRNSVEYQAFYIVERYLAQKNLGLGGASIWSYNDYFTENPQIRAAYHQPYIAYSGITNIKQQRVSYNTLKALFNNEELPVLNPGSNEASFVGVYIISGFVGIFLLGFVFNRSKRFREHLFRASFRTFNFFADIRDRRIISEAHTITLGLVISLTIAIFLSSVLNHYKLNEEFFQLTSIMIPQIFIREWFYKLAWMPEISVLVFTFLILSKIILIAFILKFASLFVRSKIYFNDTYKMVIWAGVPALLLIPFSISASRVLPISESLSYFFIAVFVLIMFWWFFRLLKSIWIVFSVRKSKVYFWTFFFIFVLAIILLSIHQYYYNFVDYLLFCLETL
ncbi:MAG: hypothetical protein N2517_05505 [Ignavibacteria bacterium]|nr:hypothetical protein [Ignavibacteria bacterium]